jgi:hypothetical protein
LIGHIWHKIPLYKNGHNYLFICRELAFKLPFAADTSKHKTASHNLCGKQ